MVVMLPVKDIVCNEEQPANVYCGSVAILQATVAVVRAEQLRKA